MKCNASVCEEEVRRFSFRYIKSVKSSNGHVVRSNRKMCEAFRVHFHDHFACCLDFAVHEFRSNLPDSPRLWEAEAASCEGVITECKVRNTLKQVGLNKSPGLDGLPNEVYLKLLHMFVLILTDMFNHLFVQGSIPSSVIKGVITLLKKGDRHVWEDLKS